MLRLEYKPYTLDFRFIAGTSRGKMTSRQVWFVKMYDANDSSTYGVGEIAPLSGLSKESIEKIPELLERIGQSEFERPQNRSDIYRLASEISEGFASVRMGVEMALLDLLNGGKQLWFDSSFTRGDQQIPINGLIWMGEEDFMREQIEQKASQGFRCIKMKIGAIDFDKELEVLRFLRSIDSELTIRVDANGAFNEENVFDRLEALSELNIHSIEQPVMAGQHSLMNRVCKESPVPVALDEELIGFHNDDKTKIGLLDRIQPPYIILKPSLLGGFLETAKWIGLAEERNIGWWITSALESNLGLNAITQFVSQYPDLPYQGLGTGQLYHNNFASKAFLDRAKMTFDPLGKDELPL